VHGAKPVAEYDPGKHVKLGVISTSGVPVVSVAIEVWNAVKSQKLDPAPPPDSALLAVVLPAPPP